KAGASSVSSERATPSTIGRILIHGRPYCSDDPRVQALPLGVKDGKLMVAVHSECTGDPTAPAWTYNGAAQIKANAARALPNGSEFGVSCFVDGQFVRTDAAAYGDAVGKTGSTRWLKGTTPGQDQGQEYLPWSNAGFVALELGGFRLPQC
ncbi:MAG TPA: hypothetical protein VIR03_03920, partial [Candidatus Saccharimonadales bacterium]